MRKARKKEMERNTKPKATRQMERETEIRRKQGKKNESQTK